MAIYHIVLLKYKEENSPDALEQIRAGRDTFLSQNPYVSGIKSGRKFGMSPFDQGYDDSIILRFENEEALKSYYPHPKHKEYEQWILPFVKNLLTFDLEMDE